MSKFYKLSLGFIVLAFFNLYFSSPAKAQSIIDCYNEPTSITVTLAEDPGNTSLTSNQPLRVTGSSDTCTGDPGVPIVIQFRSKVSQIYVGGGVQTATVQGEAGRFISFDPVTHPGLPNPGPYDVVISVLNDNSIFWIVGEISVEPNISSCGERPTDTSPCPEVCLETENRLGQAYCGCGNEDQPPCVTDNYSGFVGCVENYIVNGSNRCEHKNVNSKPNIIEITKCKDETEGIDTAIGCFRFDSPIQFIVSSYAFLLGTSGAISLILIAFAAFRIMTSSGDPRALQGSKDLLISAISGLLMVILATYLLRVIGVDILGIF